MVLGIGGFNHGLEHGAGFARIGIDREIQRVGGDPAEIDDAALDRLGRIGRLVVAFPASSTSSDICGICSDGAKVRSIGSSMSVSISSSVTTQVCPIRARTWPATWKRPPLFGVTSNEACTESTCKPPTSATALRTA